MTISDMVNLAFHNDPHLIAEATAELLVARNPNSQAYDAKSIADELRKIAADL